jgi:hypothetical protein
VDPCHFGTDPDPSIPLNDGIISIIAFYFLKVYLHQSSSHKEVTKQTVEIKVFLAIFA